MGSSSIEEFDSSQDERTPFYSVSKSKYPSLFDTSTDDGLVLLDSQRSPRILLLCLSRRYVAPFLSASALSRLIVELFGAVQVNSFTLMEWEYKGKEKLQR